MGDGVGQECSRWRVLVGVAIVGMVVAAGCSSGGGAEPTSTTAAPDDEIRVDNVARPTVEGPITTGGGKAVLAAAGFDLATVGYEESEYFVSGTASSYTSTEPLASDGRWDVSEATTAPYETRMIVRRPTDPTRFNGTVVVEWMNVSGGLDAAPDWTYTHVELIREGYAWVGVSAQAVGIYGSEGSLAASLALKTADPVRYEPLVHPGDDFSYDIFSQAGSAVRFQSDVVLGGLEPTYVLAIGESQSAFRLTSYLDAVAPVADMFDGYLVHSRGGRGAGLSADLGAPDPTLIRDDLTVPVLVFSSETDVAAVADTGLGYVSARQPDTDRFRSWEVAGTAHADAYNLGIGDPDDGSGAADLELFAAMRTPPSDLYGGLLACDSPINAGPHTYVLRSALHHLNAWVSEGVRPPSTPPIEIGSDGTIQRDERGIALGGIRTPQVDVPVATLSGLGQTGTSFCRLFGTTVPFAPDTLQADYGDHDAFVESWTRSLDSAVAGEVILEADRAHIEAAARASGVPG